LDLRLRTNKEGQSLASVIIWIPHFQWKYISFGGIKCLWTQLTRLSCRR
jgi:hypothetical protein